MSHDGKIYLYFPVDVIIVVIVVFFLLVSNPYLVQQAHVLYALIYNPKTNRDSGSAITVLLVLRCSFVMCNKQLVRLRSFWDVSC